MNNLPFELPQSIATYAERFSDDPDKATERLEKQLEKRDPDAVGHFLLAWFYYQRGEQDKAVEESLKAKVYAPGSPFFKKLHYYFVHPEMFDAWTPEMRNAVSPQSSDPDQNGPILNLDSLIQQISAVNEDDSDRRSKKRFAEQDPTSETLAGIHAQQGNIKEAIAMYKRLKENNPDKKNRYDDEIKKLKEREQENGKEES